MVWKYKIIEKHFCIEHSFCSCVTTIFLAAFIYFLWSLQSIYDICYHIWYLECSRFYWPKLILHVLKLIYIIIIIIMSCRQHGYPWPSLATSPYHSSPLAGLQGYIPYAHIAAVCMFELAVLFLLGHMWGSIEVHHLWARPCFSSSVLYIIYIYIYIYIWLKKLVDKSNTMGLVVIFNSLLTEELHQTKHFLHLSTF